MPKNNTPKEVYMVFREIPPDAPEIKDQCRSVAKWMREDGTEAPILLHVWR